MLKFLLAATVLFVFAGLPAMASDDSGEVKEGKASYYPGKKPGKKAATSEGSMTAASRTLPIGTKAKVTNQENGKTAEVTINDRGPYGKSRIINVSKSAANQLGMKSEGVAPVKVEAKPSDQTTPELKDSVAQSAK